MIYVAHPFDQTHDDSPENIHLRKLMGDVAHRMQAADIPAYWPSRPFTNPMNDTRATYDINEYALRRCSGLLALAPPGVPSVGMPMEVLTAHQLGKPIAIIGGKGSLMFEAMGRILIYENIEDAIDWVRTVPIDGTIHVNGKPEDQTILWKGDPACVPRRGYPGDAGWDLIVEKDTRIPVGGFADVPHGICMEMPPGMWALITGRSSTIRKRGILVVNGIIDNGYRGPLFAAAQNLGEKPVEVKRGERIAQVIPFPLTSQGIQLTRVAELSGHVRGQSAFGSTGV